MKVDGTIDVVDAEIMYRPDGISLWRVTEVHSGDKTFQHFFPSDTMEWRAAEYGLDLNDFETLLDIVLAEPYLDNPPERLGQPAELFSADTVEEARGIYLPRIQAAKNRNGLRSRPSSVEDPRRIIREGSPMDPEVIAYKAEYVAEGIRKHKEELQRIAEESFVPRAAQWSKIMNKMKETPRGYLNQPSFSPQAEPRPTNR